MIKLTSNGVTISVTPQDIDWYKRAGYVEVEESSEPLSDETGIRLRQHEAAQATPLSEMTLAELRGEAKARGLSGYSNLSKDDLFALLTDEKEGE